MDCRSLEFAQWIGISTRAHVAYFLVGARASLSNVGDTLQARHQQQQQERHLRISESIKKSCRLLPWNRVRQYETPNQHRISRIFVEKTSSNFGGLLVEHHHAIRSRSRSSNGECYPFSTQTRTWSWFALVIEVRDDCGSFEVFRESALGETCRPYS